MHLQEAPRAPWWTGLVCPICKSSKPNRCSRQLLGRHIKRHRWPWLSQLLQCKSLRSLVRSLPNLRCPWWTIGTNRTTSAPCSLVSTSPRTKKQWPSHLHLLRPTDLPTYSKKRPRRCATTATRRTTSRELSSLTTRTSSSRWRVTCAFCEPIDPESGNNVVLFFDVVVLWNNNQFCPELSSLLSLYHKDRGNSNLS